jgi:hypothetical protein
MADPNQKKLIGLRFEIADLVGQREGVVKRFGLDECFCLPDGNWHPNAANDYRQKYVALRDCDIEKVSEIIRPLSENYSGYRFPSDDVFSVEMQYLFNSWLTMNGKNRAYCDGKLTVTDEPFGSTQLAIPSRYLYRPLQLSGERGWLIDGVIINKDTCTYQGYINLMIHAGIIDRLEKRVRTVIVEIGAGYGALALAFSQILSGDRLYIICDLPESLMFSGLYLTLAQQSVRVAKDGYFIWSPGVVLMPNYWFHRLVELLGSWRTKVDLVLNTLSMSEMSAHQVRTYADGISRLIGDSGVFFEHNYDNHLLDKMIDCKECLPEFFSCRETIQRMAGGEALCDLWSNSPHATA